MLNWLFPSIIPEWLQHVIFPLNRWLHIVCTTLVIGGALFYEFIIPKAIEDLKEETQLAVLGRVRWFFRQVVILSSLLLLLSGGISLYQMWPLYAGHFMVVRPWVYSHVIIGVISLLIANLAVARRRAARQPLIWLRITFVILLIVIVLASIARHVRFMVRENLIRYQVSPSEAPVNP